MFSQHCVPSSFALDRCSGIGDGVDKTLSINWTRRASVFYYYGLAEMNRQTCFHTLSLSWPESWTIVNVIAAPRHSTVSFLVSFSKPQDTEKINQVRKCKTLGEHVGESDSFYSFFFLFFFFSSVNNWIQSALFSLIVVHMAACHKSLQFTDAHTSAEVCKHLTSRLLRKKKKKNHRKGINAKPQN